jgi:hypothetical protein
MVRWTFWNVPKLIRDLLFAAERLFQPVLDRLYDCAEDKTSDGASPTRKTA